MAALLAALSAQPAAAPSQIYGTYVGTQAGGTAAGDSLKILRREGRTIGISLILHFGAGQLCRMRNDGEWQGDRLVVTAEGLHENRPCRLEATFASGRVMLKDEGQRCAQVYCGTRGKIDGVTLVKARPGKK